MLQGDVKDGNVLFFPTPYRHFTGHQAKCACPDMPSNCGIVRCTNPHPDILVWPAPCGLTFES